MASSEPAQQIGIVGLGLIGGSIGLALRDTTRELIGYDSSAKAQDTALQRFCVDRIAPFEEVARSAVVFLAVPPAAVVGSAEAVLKAKSPETIVTDCASVKSEISQWAAAKRFKQFVPGHPMAGHEKSGAEFASSWLFRHAKWILTPIRPSSAAAVSAIQTLVKAMGAQPVRLEPEVHDRLVALLSHLPHAIAALLVLMGDEYDQLDIAAGSWRDLTRVGGVDPSLWTEILMGNRKELISILDEFEGSLALLRAFLRTEDAPALRELFERARKAKTAQDAKLPSLPKAPSRPRTSRSARRFT